MIYYILYFIYYILYFIFYILIFYILYIYIYISPHHIPMASECSVAPGHPPLLLAFLEDLVEKKEDQNGCP